ncbi:MAG: hypothetical protein HYW25_03095 [Candidatus Aenigmarchaeota archaeon]|nr:hypothetical protein [Candidatus Aenigmarchaeota archaeon]
MNTVQANRSAFAETFGETPLVKVIDFFLTYPDFDYSKSQVANETGISRITIEGIWNKLIKRGIISKTRNLGRAELYRLNRESPLVKILMKTAFDLSAHFLEEESGLQKKLSSLA